MLSQGIYSNFDRKLRVYSRILLYNDHNREKKKIKRQINENKHERKTELLTNDHELDRLTFTSVS